jgi:putative membrane protein
MMTGFGMGFGGGLVMVLFWIVLIVGAVWLVRSFFPTGQQPSASSTRSEPSAGEILKQRYVRGEITKEQFEQMRRDLDV